MGNAFKCEHIIYSSYFFPLKTICLYFIINIYYNAIRVAVAGFVTFYQGFKRDYFAISSASVRYETVKNIYIYS